MGGGYCIISDFWCLWWTKRGENILGVSHRTANFLGGNEASFIEGPCHGETARVF